MPWERANTSTFNLPLWRYGEGTDDWQILLKADSVLFWIFFFFIIFLFLYSLDTGIYWSETGPVYTVVSNVQRLFRTALFLGLCHIAVLDAQHDVGTGAAAGGLLEELASLQRRGQACHCTVAGPPCLTVVIRLPVTPAIGAMPDHLLRPTEHRKKNGHFRWF